MSHKILIFTHSAAGHHPEYLHHLYMGVLERAGLECVIAVPASFASRRSLFDWPECERISFDLIPDDKVSWGDGKWYKRNWRFAHLLRAYVRKHQPEELFLVDPMMLMPYLAFMVPRGVRVSGILYGIYMYRWQELSFPRRVAEILWHWLLARRRGFKTLFVLNDAEAAAHFNRCYHTDRFRALPDPIMPVSASTADFRAKYGIAANRMVLLHFGSFGKKKGTLEILKSALALPEAERTKYCFVFAGCVQPVIRDEFYQLVGQLQATETQCLVFDRFCSYVFIADWCRACDAILVPYLMAYNSSGCIGYAAQFNKPVIGPRYGLLGKLIGKYHLGIQLATVTPENLTGAYREIKGVDCDGAAYWRANDVAAFNHAILDADA